MRGRLRKKKDFQAICPKVLDGMEVFAIPPLLAVSIGCDYAQPQQTGMLLIMRQQVHSALSMQLRQSQHD